MRYIVFTSCFTLSYLFISSCLANEQAIATDEESARAQCSQSKIKVRSATLLSNNELSANDEQALFHSTLAVGQTLEFLLASEGDPNHVMHALPDGKHFDSYYYIDSNTTYIINTETSYICAISMGKHTGSCTLDNE